jgi:peptidase MA superfamily protein
VLVVARKPDLKLGLALAKVAATPRDWLGLGRREPGALRLIVLRGEKRVAGILHEQAPSWGAGFTLPGARTILIRADAGEPYQILRHELAHLALHDAIRVRVPLWFDEGYAALAAGELDRLDALRLNLSIARGRVPGFFELDRGLRGPEPTARTAYGLAASAVGLLARRHPEHSLVPLLNRLAAGEGFADAVLATTGSPLGRFEVEWQKDVRRHFGLFGWVMAGGLWIGIALLLLLAVALRRRRDRPRRQALDEGWIVEPDPEPPPLDEAGTGP